ncbi:MAG: exosome complex protein Rrp42 [Candidatus Hermodarchaeota archaeon]
MITSYGIATKIRKKKISTLLTQDKRLDGRGLTDYRKMQVEVGLIDKAIGSALVTLGNTKVLVGVKIELGTPYPDIPDRGVQIVNAELVPLASPSFESGPPREDSIELARVVDRGIRESEAIDTKKLCVVPGKKVFLVFVDIYILDYDGNLIDASALASISALLTSKMKEYVVQKDGEVEFTENYVKLPVMNHPVEVTIAKIDDKLIVDPSLEEELVTSTQITIAIDKDERICAIQKSKPGTFTSEEVAKAIQIAKIKAKEIQDTFLSEMILDEET